MSVSIKAEATIPISEGCLKKMINGSSSSVSPTGGGGNLTPPSPLEATVKAETSRIMSPNLTKNNTSSSQAASNPNSDVSESSSSGQKRIQNNNTSSYTSGGRLKFYKEGRCLLELTHKSNQEGSENWVPIAKKVYWPPPGPVKAESSPSVQSASEAGSDVGSSSPSPWQPGVPSTAPAVAPLTAQSLIRPSRKNRGIKPVAFRKQPLNILQELCFAMKPPACIVSLRKKVRKLRRKRRRPFDPILVGAFLMRIEAQAVKTRPRRKPFEMDRIKQASRLERTVTKLGATAKKAPPPKLVQIGTWKPKNSSSSSSMSQTSSSKNGSIGLNKIKSELCPVTETCTAATLPPATPSTPNHKHRVKAEKTVSLSTASGLMAATPTAAKTLPITPTMARIKRDGGSLSAGGHSIHSSEFQSSSTSLISPDMQRVKVEIGHSPFNFRNTPPAEMPRLPTSPVSQMDMSGSPHFISPRKRSLLRDYENGSPSIKRHRMSTDSRGSSSEGGGAGSPSLGASPPRHNNGGRVSSFSIDSIMSSSSSSTTNNASGGGATVHRPVPLPASPARVASKSPPVPSTPLNIPITPYSARGTPQAPGGGAMQLNPYLAHLAGVAANPSLGLSPSTHAQAVINYQYAALLGAQMYAQHAINATPPTSQHSRSSSSRQSSGNVSSPHGERPFSPLGVPQYRGEPKVATPTPKATPMDIPSRLVPTESGELPLNLSVKK